MKKRFTIDHNEQIETDNAVQAEQIFVVEQNNGSITAPATKTIGSDTYNFVGWTDGDMNQAKTITSPTSNLSYTAQYHGKLRTGRPDLTDTKNQRRLVTYGGASGNWGMVYESMGNVYLSFSGDGGVNWYNNEVRLNSVIGAATNPTVSNLLMYNGTRPCILIAWVETVGGASTLHFQTLQLYGGYYWGWGYYADAGQDASNHRTLNQIELGSTGSTGVWNLRSDARPVVQITQVGNAIRTYLAYEGTDDKLHTAFMTSPTADDDLEGTYIDRVGFDPYVRTASTYSAYYPAIITYPSSYGFPAKTYVYFLSGGYAAGRRIAQYDFDTKSEGVLSNPNNDYTYFSLQGSVNPNNNTYGLVAEALGNDMSTFKVNYYFKPTYMGSSAPSLSTVFSGMKQPSLMFDQTSGFGSSSSAGTPVMKSTGNNSFYQYISPTLSEIGPNIGGIFSQERVASGDRTAMVAKTVTSPATIVRYSGSGLAKGNGGVPINVTAVRTWLDDEGVEYGIALDVSDANLDFVDSLETEERFYAMKVSTNLDFTVTQSGTKCHPLSAQLIRNGNIVRSFAASAWRKISRESIPEVQEGDIVLLSMPGKNKKSAFTIITLQDDSFAKHNDNGDLLIPTEIAVGAYPNPFNPSTTFRVSLPQATNVRLAVYNMLGQKVATLVDGMVQAGYNDFRFDGSSLSTGIYLYRMEIVEEGKKEVKSGKVMLMK